MRWGSPVLAETLSNALAGTLCPQQPLPAATVTRVCSHTLAEECAELEALPQRLLCGLWPPERDSSDSSLDWLELRVRRVVLASSFAF
jgi:hypothetical protein